jgi:hypothetical protein
MHRARVFLTGLGLDRLAFAPYDRQLGFLEKLLWIFAESVEAVRVAEIVSLP